MNRTNKRPEIICRCNNISRETIEDAIRDGCHTMNEIYDTTSAGVGPCGGSCRRVIVPILKKFLECGEFPQSQPSHRSPGQASATPKTDKKSE